MIAKGQVTRFHSAALPAAVLEQNLNVFLPALVLQRLLGSSATAVSSTPTLAYFLPI